MTTAIASSALVPKTKISGNIMVELLLLLELNAACPQRHLPRQTRRRQALVTLDRPIQPQQAQRHQTHPTH